MLSTSNVFPSSGAKVVVAASVVINFTSVCVSTLSSAFTTSSTSANLASLTATFSTVILYVFTMAAVLAPTVGVSVTVTVAAPFFTALSTAVTVA